jgi:hypothetical protein
MNKHDVHLLQQISSYPSVSITLPTHRTSPLNKQDPIRVKQLAREAVDRLLGEFSKREIEPIVTRLENLVDSLDYRNALDGLALFVNNDFSRAFYLPITIKERVVVDQTFFTRDLVHAINRSTRYWVLALSEQPTRLFEGVRDALVEIREEGFPFTHTGPGGASALPGGPGVRKSAYRDEYHRQFFRQVDAAFMPFMADDPLPLVVVGVDRFLAFFREVSAHAGSVIAEVQGSHDKTSAHDLGKLVWPQAKERLLELRQGVFLELDKAVGERKVASSAGEVWRLAHEGRGHMLLVEEDFHFPARLDESGTHITLADDPAAQDVIDDAVDDIIEEVLRKQGQVVFVDNGKLDQHQRIALILRY